MPFKIPAMWLNRITCILLIFLITTMQISSKCLKVELEVKSVTIMIFEKIFGQIIVFTVHAKVYEQTIRHFVLILKNNLSK